MKSELTIRWWYNTTWDKEVGKIKVKYKTRIREQRIKTNNYATKKHNSTSSRKKTANSSR